MLKFIKDSEKTIQLIALQKLPHFIYLIDNYDWNLF